MEILRHLVDDIGPRWAGRSGAAQAAAYLAQTFDALGLDTRVQRFPFLGWELDTTPTLEVLAPTASQASVALMEYSGSTLPGGIVGELRPAGTAYVVPGFLEWPRYAVVPDDGAPAAYLIAHIGLSGWLGPAIPLANPDPMYPIPMAVLAEAEHRRFQAWLDAGERIRVRFHTCGHTVGPLTGRNVIATLPGVSRRTVVFCAHLDTAYGTPGANNNAGGLQALVDLAQQFIADGPQRLTYQFLACDAAEWHFLGSRHFVQQLHADGQLDTILAAINVDTVASGTELFVVAWPEHMRRRAEQVVDQLGLRDLFTRVTLLGPVAGSDHISFIQASVAAAEILFWPCEVYKLPTDDLQHVDRALIRRSVAIARALAQTFEEEA